MKSACLYLEGGTHSCQVATSHLVSLEETLIEFQVPEEGTVVSFIY